MIYSGELGRDSLEKQTSHVLHAKRNNIYLCEHHFKSMLILWAQQRSINMRHTLIIIVFVFYVIITLFQSILCYILYSTEQDKSDWVIFCTSYEL